jgi:hypothetical protein
LAVKTAPNRTPCFVRILLGAAALSLIDVAAAEVASDNELYAAYCIGVLQHTQQEGEKLWVEYEQGLLNDDKQFRDEVRRLRQEDAKNLEQKLSRFRTYLAVRGFRPTGGRDRQAYTGIEVALQRGRSDDEQCDQFSKNSCTPRCAVDSEALIKGLDPGLIGKCADQCCAENVVCRSSARCLQADNLPF